MGRVGDFLDLSKSSGEIPSMKALIDFLQVDGPMAEKFREAKESFGMISMVGVSGGSKWLGMPDMFSMPYDVYVN